MIRLLHIIVFVVVIATAAAGCSSPRFAGGKHETSESDIRAPYSQEGFASYYAHEFHGRKTSNGETYDMNQLTAAHRTLPFGTRVRVRNLENGKTVVVRINDRGPFKDNRIIDLSLAAGKEIGLILPGTVRVRLEVIELGSGK